MSRSSPVFFPEFINTGGDISLAQQFKYLHESDEAIFFHFN